MLGNLSVHELLTDPAHLFWTSHKNQPGAAAYDPAAPGFAARAERWAHKMYPAGVSFETNETTNGFILQADFCKFAGRGFLQLTGRNNYKYAIEYVKSYSGMDPVVLEYKQKWAGKSEEEVATTSSQADWRVLFEGTSHYHLSTMSIVIHSEKHGNYLKLSDQESILNADQTTAGSLAFMAWRVNRSKVYLARFIGRVRDFCRALSALEA